MNVTIISLDTFFFWGSDLLFRRYTQKVILHYRGCGGRRGWGAKTIFFATMFRKVHLNHTGDEESEKLNIRL